MATHNPYITPKLFKFFCDLKKNNDREWFEANKQRYEDDVRTPLLAFIDDFAEPLYKISPHFRADARKVGGSLFRIFRDVRFSKDKSPYKTRPGCTSDTRMRRTPMPPASICTWNRERCFSAQASGIQRQPSHDRSGRRSSSIPIAGRRR